MRWIIITLTTVLLLLYLLNYVVSTYQ